MTGKHKIGAEVLPKMANIFVKLTDFDVDADTLVSIMEKTTVSFQHLGFHAESSTEWPEEGALEERFACFEYVDVHTYATCNHKDHMPGKKFELLVRIKLEY
uniref:Hemocyanin_C domain-containing protein n=1 Tax=Panagrellus redivivus TaxID=6233 RepID=A0A7E5A1L7_PANRE